MNNNNYNSLTEQLIQNGILSSSKEEKEKNFLESFYGIELDENMSNSPFVQQPIQNNEIEQKNKKRINQYDLELIQNLNDSPHQNQKVDSAIKTLKRFLNFKQNAIQRGGIFSVESFLLRFFPRIYKAKLVKEAMFKMKELNIDVKTLLDKTIPYGESEGRYEDLIKYLNYANELQTRLKKKI